MPGARTQQIHSFKMRITCMLSVLLEYAHVSVRTVTATQHTDITCMHVQQQLRSCGASSSPVVIRLYAHLFFVFLRMMRCKIKGIQACGQVSNGSDEEGCLRDVMLFAHVANAVDGGRLFAFNLSSLGKGHIYMFRVHT
uniref:Uncharacterized protein n=1 Tax=Lotharella oceanica TaxID=641309 RepID=A0A7S2TZK5_9EUKA|mmetsp:Transcript_34368/g.63731  ORF Transcript_34368/g.63731 Transcript_34368/m.63731 type:complete len:139 (+) Transcript_34368:35-451(+)